jgi:hypothetical protein
MAGMHEVELAVRVVTLPLMGVLAALSAVRDSAARMRIRDDEMAAERAVSWSNLTGDERALVIDWTFGR